MASRLRRKHGEALSLVAITGDGMESDRDRARAADCGLHLLEPVSIEELRAVLERPADAAG